MTEEEHVKALLAMAHLPLLDESVKPESIKVSVSPGGDQMVRTYHLRSQ